MADFNDPVTQALQARAASGPAVGQVPTSQGDAQYAQNVQDEQAAASRVQSGAMGGGQDQDSPTPYGFNPQTGVVLVNGQPLPHDFQAWSHAAALPAEALQPMSVNAIQKDGFIPLSQDQFRTFITNTDATAQSHLLGDAGHALWGATKDAAAGAVREVSRLPQIMAQTPMGRIMAPVADWAGQNIPGVQAIQEYNKSSQQAAADAGAQAADAIGGGTAADDAARRAGQTMQEQAYSGATFGTHPMRALANVAANQIPGMIPGAAAFAVNPALGAAVFGAQGAQGSAEEMGARFDEAAAKNPAMFSSSNPVYAQMRAQGMNDTQAREAMRSQAVSTAGDVGGAASAALAPLAGRPALAAVGAAEALAPGMGGSGVGGFLARRLAMAGLTAGENAAITAGSTVPAQVAGDVASGQGVQPAGSYAGNLSTPAIVGGILGALTHSRARPTDPVASAAASDIGAAAGAVEGIPQAPDTAAPAAPPPPVGMSQDMFGTAPPSQPTPNAVPEAPAAPTPGPSPAQGELLPPVGPQLPQRAAPSLIAQRAAEQARVAPQGVQGALPPPTPPVSIDALQQVRATLADQLSNLPNKRTVAGRRLTQNLASLDQLLTQRTAEEAAQVPPAAPDQAPPGNTEPPPIGTDQPMSPEEAASRAQMQAQRGQVPATPAPTAEHPLVTQSEQGVSPSTPEPPQDLAAQLKAVQDGSRDAVFVAQGNEAQAPKVPGQVVRKVVRPEGTLYTTNAAKAKAYREAPQLNDELLARIQDLPQSKADALRTGDDTVTQALDANGAVVKEALGQGNTAAVAQAAPEDGSVRQLPAAEAQARREELNRRFDAGENLTPDETAELIRSTREQRDIGKPGQQPLEGMLNGTAGPDAAAQRGDKGFHYADVNGLKATNDAFGHDAGNKLLQSFGQLYRDVAAKHGGQSWLAGGDEFASSFPNVAAARKAHAELQSQAKNASFTFKTTDGVTHEVQGLNYAGGVGKNVESADAASQAAKRAYYKAAGIERRGEADTRRAQEPVVRANEPGGQAGRRSRAGQPADSNAPAQREVTPTRSASLKERAASQRATVADKAAVEEAVGKKKVPVAEPTEVAATKALRDDVAANHPQQLDAFDNQEPREGAGRRPESPLTAVPVTEKEMGTLADHAKDTAGTEAQQIADGTWSARKSDVARLLDAAGIRPNEAQLKKAIDQLAKATPEQLRAFMQAAGPRLADSTLAKGIVRGMDNVRAAVKDSHGAAEPVDAYDGKQLRQMNIGAGERTVSDKLPEKNELYSRGRVTMYGKEVPAQVGEAIREWTRTFEKTAGRFLPDQMHVMTPEQAADRYGRAQVKAAGGDGEAFSGQLTNPATGKPEHVIAVDWKALGEGPSAVETVAHEFAHTAMDTVFDKLPKADQDAVRASYNDWLSAQGRGNPTESMLNRLPPALADMMREAGTKPEKAYAESWHEWVADQVAKWMLTDERPRTAVERFFSALSEAFKKIYASVTGRGRPTEAVATMMDNLVERSQDLRSQDRTARANQFAYGRDPAESPKPAEVARQKIDLNAVKQRADKIASGAKELGKDLGKSFEDPSAIKARVSRAWQNAADSKAGDVGRKIAFGVMSTRDVVDRYRKRGGFGEGLVDWDNQNRLAEKLGREVQQRANIASEHARRLSDPVRTALNKLMYKSTVYGVHPDEAFGTGKNSHLRDDDPSVTESNRARYQEVRGLWDQMQGLHGDPQKVFKELRDSIGQIRRDTFTAYHANVDSADVSSDAKADMHARLSALEERTGDGPYFPLVREGNYVTTALMPAKPLGEYETKAEAQKIGAREKAINPHAEIMVSKTPDGTWTVHAGEKAVYYHPTVKDAKAAMPGIESEMREAWQHLNVDMDKAQAELGNKPIFEGPFHTQDFFKKMEVPDLTKFTHEINDLYSAGKIDPEVYKQFSEMALEAAPETNPRKSMMQRKNIRGANMDMLGGYARNVAGAAHTFGKAKVARDLSDAWAKMAQHSREAPDLNDVMNDLKKRQDTLAKRMERNWVNTTANTVQDLSSLMSLGLSPAFMVQQALQPAILTAPVLAARDAHGKAVGYGNAMKYLKDAYQGAVPFFGKRGGEQFMAEVKRMMGTYGGAGRTLQESASDMMNTFGKTDEEKQMLHYLNDRGTLDFAFLNAVADANAQSSLGNKAKAALRLSMAIPQQIEAMNRMVSGLAAYRIAREVRGFDHAQALHEADTVVAQTHGDYSRYNRPSVFNRPLGGMMLQFKMYTQFMYSLLTRNVVNMFDSSLSRDDRMQAVRTLGYVMGSHAAFGGAIGLGPVAAAAKYGLGGLMYAAAGAGLIDKKKKDMTIGDWITADFENWADDQMGKGAGRYLRQVAEYGLPGAAGIDIANKIALPDLTDTRFAGPPPKEGEAAGSMLDRIVIAGLGPLYSNAKRVANGTQALLQGNLVGAGKQMLPAAPRALLNAITESQNGVATAGGQVIRPADDISPYNTFLRAAGLQDPQTGMAYEDRAARAEAKQRIQYSRDQLLQEYQAAKTADDRHDVMQKIADFNQGRDKTLQISSATLSRQLLRQPLSKTDKIIGRAIGQ